MLRRTTLLLALLAWMPVVAIAQDRDTKVHNDRSNSESDGYWIYNDLPKALEAARKSKKPLLIVFR